MLISLISCLLLYPSRSLSCLSILVGPRRLILPTRNSNICPLCLPFFLQLAVPSPVPPSHAAGAGGAAASLTGERRPAGKRTGIRTTARFIPPTRPSKDTDCRRSSRDQTAAGAAYITSDSSSESQLAGSALQPLTASSPGPRNPIAGREAGCVAAGGRELAAVQGPRASSSDAETLAAEAMALCGLFRGVTEGAVSAGAGEVDSDHRV